MFSTTDIRNIAFEAINDRFSKGKYLGVEVTIDMTNGYINGPHLVGQVMTSGGIPKQFKNWRKTAEADSIVDYLAATIVAVDIITDVTDAPNGLRGAYIHPRLVAHVAQWASPIFADKVALIINDRAISDAVAEKNKVIQAQAGTINSLEAKIDLLIAEVKAGREDNHHIQNQLDNVAEDLDAAAQVNDQLSADVAAIAVKLNVATDQRVPPARPQSNEVFAVFGRPGTQRYRMVRRQKRTYQQGANTCVRDGYTERVFYSDSPNAVNLGIRLKDIMPAILGAVSGVSIVLAVDKNREDLVVYIETAEREKKNV